MEHLNRYMNQVVSTLQILPQQPLDAIAKTLWEIYRRDGTIFVCGNGGSAATASHFACDLAKWTIHPRARRVRALALTDNIPIMTAWSNDQSYASVFVEQMISHYRPGDMIVAISGSGNSPNILEAVDWANQVGAITVGITGFDGGRLYQIAQVPMRVENYCMPQVEDAHSMICHALAVNLGQQIEESLSELTVEASAPQLVLLERMVGGHD
ncbi:MAG: SIS domain-containing protein [Chloroflexales bacterium]